MQVNNNFHKRAIRIFLPNRAVFGLTLPRRNGSELRSTGAFAQDG
jgi:hypothetical protein